MAAIALTTLLHPHDAMHYIHKRDVTALPSQAIIQIKPISLINSTKFNLNDINARNKPCDKLFKFIVFFYFNLLISNHKIIIINQIFKDLKIVDKFL